MVRHRLFACDGFKSQITLRTASTSYVYRSLRRANVASRDLTNKYSPFSTLKVLWKHKCDHFLARMLGNGGFSVAARLGRIHGRRKRMNVDGQAAVGDQLTTDGGYAFGLRRG